MIESELMKILCCPETHQDLRPAGAALVEKLNGQIATGTLRNRGGQSVKEKLDDALLRADGKLLYVIRQDIPVMLMDEAIPILP